MPVLERDVFPPGNEEGCGHWSGVGCPCNPWAYQDVNVVVVHRYPTEAVIHVGSGCPDGEYGDYAEWVEVEVE